MREHARNWLELSDKVIHYRRDLLAAAAVAEIQSRSAKVRTELKEKAGAEKLKLSLESLEESLRQHGGKIYPKGWIADNAEFLLWAAIVILGLRAYFIQPFKIPTNSMWPSYYGMTPEVFTSREEEPSRVQSLARTVLFGARERRLDAPMDGEVLLAETAMEVPGRTWLVFPTKFSQYTLFVGNMPVHVTVPKEFDMKLVFREAFPDLGRLIREGQFLTATVGEGGNARPVRLLRTGKRVRAGERVLSFDIMTGDQLFADRFSYHFVEPKVGSGFVFRTGNIPDLRLSYGDQYYIKRLIGKPGDQIEIKVPATARNRAGEQEGLNPSGTLMRNGKPIDGARAFDLNNNHVAPYAGYFATDRLAAGQVVKVPAESYFAMGDNSGNSYDGRAWGFVPKKDVVGRPLIIYYPFSKRWGLAN